ncbi:MAG: UbiA family prenyltransferase [Saprospiraceae bacterium]|nr:UbiA family prenyltransferase [Saprospiraceae bacterium]
MKNYLSLIKFSHTIFAMPFAMVGYVLAVAKEGRSFDLKLLALVILCMIFARSAAMAFNRWLDRDIDAQNPRTSIREIPSGIVAAESALIFVIFNCSLFVLSTWFINPLCFYLSPVALLVVLGYSYTKRFTSLCHLVLGLGLSLAPVGAFLAVTGKFETVPVLLGFSVLFWVSGFDIIYALQDEDFDRKHHLNSIPVFMGQIKSFRLSELLHLLSAAFLIAGLVLAKDYYALSYVSIIAVSIFLVMLVYQHLIIKPSDLSRVNVAFFTTNGIASVIFGTLFILDLLF